MKISVKICLLSIFILSKTALSQITPTPVEAGYLYEGGYLNIRTPNSEGWDLVSNSQSGMDFARIGINKHESFGAQVALFALPSTETQNEFVKLIKKAIKANTSSSRFKTLSSEYLYTEERGYQCVKVDSTVKDKKTKINGKKGKLLLQFISLYCRHPVRTNTGFSATYSFRGVNLYDNLSNEANDFIKGIYVSKSEK